MPRPRYSHHSSWPSDSRESPFVRNSFGHRQRSKLFLPAPPPVYRRPFSRQFWGGARVRSKRYQNRQRPFGVRAELGATPLLNPVVESVAQNSSSLVSLPAEPLLLSVESTAPLGQLDHDDLSIMASPAPGPAFSLPFEDLFPPQFFPPSRPNTDPRANLAPASSAGLPFVTSSLNRDAWEYFLRDYPDRSLVSCLLHIIDHGANIGFSGDYGVSQNCQNLSSTLTYPTAVDDAISTQLARGRIRGPYTSPPFTHFRSSPLGVAARKHSGKLRQIHHLSWPRGSSVNNGIPDSEASITYDMFDRAVADLVASGPGSSMIKLDLEQAFRHIPIRPADWPLLGYHWRGNFYYELFLMFGLRSAPYIFNLFAEALHWILQHHLPARIRHYLDDFLKIFSPGVHPDHVHASLTWARALAKILGLNFQEEKVLGPTFVLEFLGIILDSQRMEARLPAEKLVFLQSLLASWLTRSHCTQRELAELTGYLQFCAQVIPYSRAFLRSMFDFSASFRTPFARRRIPRSMHRDLQWWATFSSAWNGIRLLSPSRDTVHVYTDASGSKGAGGTFGSLWFSVRIPARYKTRDIQFKEFYAVIQAILCWGPQFSGKCVVFHIDNQAVDAAIRNLSMRSAPTMALIRQFLGFACQLDFEFTSAWISTHDNGVADAASRFQFSRMFELAPHLSRSSSPKLLSLADSRFTSTTPRPSSSF